MKLSPPSHKIFTHLFYIDEYPQGSKAVAEKQAREKLEFVNAKLEGKNFLIDDFSIADAYMVVVLSWCKYLSLDFKDYPNIKNYYTNLLARPSISKALKEEGLNFGK